MVSKIKIAALISFTLFLFSSCTNKKAEEAAKPAEEVKEFRIFTWSEYFDESAIKAFEKENNVKVKADYFSSNEQLLAKIQLSLQSSDPGYDLILPSDYMVRIMSELGSLQPLDKSKLPFLSEFDKESLHPEYDKDLTHSVPMAIGTTGVAINTKFLPELKGKSISWKDIFENPKYAGKVSLINDTKEVLQAALLVSGKNLSTATEADVKAAFEYLKSKKKQIKLFTDETRPVIESGECSICMVYSGDAITASKNKPEIQFTLPKEGANTWADNFAIPKNAKNTELAYKFMNSVLSAQGAKDFTERTNYRTANFKAKAMLPKEVASNSTIYPNETDRKRFVYLMERKDLALLIDKEWTILRSQ